jgi:hypothetical protein
VRWLAYGLNGGHSDQSNKRGSLLDALVQGPDLTSSNRFCGPHAMFQILSALVPRNAA